ncbi:TPA: hypothetical protein ACH3X1_005153 [Trebouxia sp. C0004]
MTQNRFEQELADRRIAGAMGELGQGKYSSPRMQVEAIVIHIIEPMVASQNWVSKYSEPQSHLFAKSV